MDRYTEVRHSGHGPCLSVGQQVAWTGTMRSDTLVMVLVLVSVSRLRGQVQ